MSHLCLWPAYLQKFLAFLQHSEIGSSTTHLKHSEIFAAVFWRGAAFKILGNIQKLVWRRCFVHLKVFILFFLWNFCLLKSAFSRAAKILIKEGFWEKKFWFFHWKISASFWVFNGKDCWILLNSAPFWSSWKVFKISFWKISEFFHWKFSAILIFSAAGLLKKKFMGFIGNLLLHFSTWNF